MSKKSSAVAPRQPRTSSTPDDSAIRALNEQDRSKLDIDSWEPSLLRHMLKAEGKLPKKR